MKKPDKTKNEEERLKALYDYKILDSIPEKQYDDLTNIASSICNTPISLISLVDQNRQWFKSNHGISDTETSREVSFCAHAIHKPEEIMIIPDARKDERFADNPLVIGSSQFIFYAGAPLVTPEGHALGTLCIIDHKPKKITQEQVDALKGLARQIVSLFELQKKNLQLKELTEELTKTNDLLSRFAYAASHDLKAPLKSIRQLSLLLDKVLQPNTSEDVTEMLRLLISKTETMENLVSGILNYSKSSNLLSEQKEEFTLPDLLHEITDFIDIPRGFHIQYDKDPIKIKTHKIALQQIFSNLINNAIKYNDKDGGEIKVSFQERKWYYVFTVSDDGRGIPKDQQKEIFKPFTTLGVKDRNNQKGTGMGLAIVNKMVELMNGKIKLDSTEGKGTQIEFSIRK